MDTNKEYLESLQDGTFFPKPDVERTLEQHDPSADARCVMCENAAFHWCSYCSAPYCSEACQAEDWPIHVNICSDMTGDLASSYRPSQNARRMLVFPVAEANPRLVWVDNNFVKDTPDYMAGICQFFEVPASDLESFSINYSIPYRKCGHGLRLMSFGLGAPQAFAPMNRSIMNLSPLPGHAMIQHGPVVVYSEHPTTTSVTTKLDITARDLRSVVDFFQLMKLNPCIINQSRFPARFHNCQMWPAIKINCDGDIARFRSFMPDGNELPRYQHVMVPSIALESDRYPVWWAEVLGLSWMISRPYTNEGVHNSQRRNTAGKWFCTAMNPAAVNNMTPSGIQDTLDSFWEYNEDMGTLIVSHVEGAAIYPLHLRWLDCWIDDCLPEGKGGEYNIRKDPYGIHNALRGSADRGIRWVRAVDRAKQHWAGFLERNKHDPDAVSIVSPWDT